jgi:hypothetical protein
LWCVLAGPRSRSLSHPPTHAAPPPPRFRGDGPGEAEFSDEVPSLLVYVSSNSSSFDSPPSNACTCSCGSFEYTSEVGFWNRIFINHIHKLFFETHQRSRLVRVLAILPATDRWLGLESCARCREAVKVLVFLSPRIFAWRHNANVPRIICRFHPAPVQHEILSVATILFPNRRQLVTA